MSTLATLLRDADPLAEEPQQSTEALTRTRQVIVAHVHAHEQPTRRSLLRAAFAVVAVGAVVTAAQYWIGSQADLRAAVRFEIHLAEADAAPGLKEVVTANGDRIFLHGESVIVNGDIAEAHAVPADDAGAFHVAVVLTPAGAKKMLAASELHVGRPLAIMIDGDVVLAPVITGSIDDEAMISGSYSKAEAERIALGILGK